jgi:hypothetical protein
MKIFVCFIKQAPLLAIVSKLGGGVFFGAASLNKNESLLWAYF